MTDKLRRYALLFALCGAFGLGVGVGYGWFVPPLERDMARISEAKAKADLELIGRGAQLIAASAKAANDTMTNREEKHADVRGEAEQSQQSIAVASADGDDLDADLPAVFVTPLVRVYCAAARANDCAGAVCVDSAASRVCAQADVGAQVTLTVRELGAALVRCARWTGEAAADRGAICEWSETLEGETMGKTSGCLR